MHRLTVFVATILAAAGIAMAPFAVAQSEALPAPSSPSHNPIKLKLEDFTNPHSSGIVLPLDINYSRETRNVVMPLDAQKLWGVGVNLDIGNARDFNTNSGLGVELKKTPGVVLQRNF
ncbi:MAG TPA: hypothetical protein VMT94_01605 [Burkholderiales bacterium]|nr:hypothetical protein [Burkholderiales bacterium]